jgi:hypothetical protein
VAIARDLPATWLSPVQLWYDLLIFKLCMIISFLHLFYFYAATCVGRCLPQCH